MGDIFYSDDFTLERTPRRFNPPVRRGLKGLYLFGASEEYSIYNHKSGGDAARVTAGSPIPCNDHSAFLTSSTHRVDLGYGDTVSGSFAIVVRMNVIATSNAERPTILETQLSNGKGVDLLEWTGGKLRMRVNSGGQEFTADIVPSNIQAWRLLIGTWTNSSMTLYDMTGGQSDTTALSGARELGDGNWCVGGTGDNSFDGNFVISPLMIADTAWTEAERAAVYEGVKPYCTRRNMLI